MIWVFLIFCGLFSITVWVRNTTMFDNFCLHTYDFGIFLESIKKFSQGAWNPFLNCRQVTYFQDHWEPAMALVGHAFPGGSLSHYAFAVELIFVVGTAFSFYWIFRMKNLEPLGAFLATLLLSNRDVMEAVFFPIHPSTWVMLPLSLLMLVALDQVARPSTQKSIAIVLLSIGLSFFNEQFSLAAVGLAMGFFFFKNTRRLGFVLLPIALVVAWWAVRGRGLIVGELFFHTHRIKTSPDELAKIYAWDANQFKTVVGFLVGYAPVLYLLYKSKASFSVEGFKKVFLVVALVSPLLLGRVLSNSFGFHYSVILTIGLMGLFISLVDTKLLTKKAVVVSSIFFLLAANHKFSKAADIALAGKLPNCVRNLPTESSTRHEVLAARKEKLQEAVAHLKGLGRINVLVTGNLLPNLVEYLPEAEIFQIGAFEITNIDKFDWLLIEKGDFGDHFNADGAKVLAVVDDLRAKGKIETVMETPGMLLARGDIRREDFKQFYYDQHYNPAK